MQLLQVIISLIILIVNFLCNDMFYTTKLDNHHVLFFSISALQIGNSNLVISTV